MHSKENNSGSSSNNRGFSPAISSGSSKAPRNRGYSNRNFLLAFREYNGEHRPDIVCLVEPRVSVQIGLNESFFRKDFDLLSLTILLLDKKSPVSVGKRCDFFGNFVDSCKLQDLGYSGPSFTWQRGGIFVRLDRALANDAWVSAFPQYLVRHFTCIKSDHRPLLLSIRPDLSIPQDRLFRFLAGWTKHNDFSFFVRERWNHADWNKNIYGFLGTHHDILQSNAVEFFERLYGEAHSALRDIPNVGFPSFNYSNITFLEAAITNEEIKRVLGSDGFHAHFFQSQWDILGNNVCQWVKDVFAGRQIEPNLNNTLIVLIPKKENPED
ncbi:tyrosine decarboxylase 1-like [Gossypium australe]|uniref:Tyrosine decarboxylase 1-like n=1 Tax=Gossypium australe TaxID=47621 RepID=A0A5B6VYH3_9ROSI|nr:tyrosine decarboxylase 1-like [Gossypium australe]